MVTPPAEKQLSGWPLEVDRDQLKAIIKADPLTSTQEVAKELSVDHYTVTWHLKQIGKVKKLDEWVPHGLTTNQNIVILNCCLLLFMKQQ